MVRLEQAAEEPLALDLADGAVRRRWNDFTSVEVGQFTHAVYNTETMLARTVKVWLEAPPIPQPAEPAPMPAD